MTKATGNMVTGTSAEAFWEEHYASRSGQTSGTPSTALLRFVQDRKPGRSLDLGCAKGDDAVWLARNGWLAMGVDVSTTVLAHARANAARAGVEKRATFEQHDLSQSLPGGPFDLVSAMFLHSPVAFTRADVLRRAAALIAPGGLLLSVTHASSAPWSWSDPDKVWPTVEEELADIGLPEDEWTRLIIQAEEREAIGPNGAKAMVTDNIIAVERR